MEGRVCPWTSSASCCCFASGVILGNVLACAALSAFKNCSTCILCLIAISCSLSEFFTFKSVLPLLFFANSASSAFICGF